MKSRSWLKLGNLCREHANLIDQLCSRTRAT
uniref:Uncharacterized protein n=1 Tax=Arundo donax TaxID=35708 RepID=A0A0A9F003_ARUDO